MNRKVSIYGILVPVLLILLAGTYRVEQTSSKPNKLLQIGEKMPLPKYQLQDTNFNMLSLSMMKKKNGLLVLFTANSCGVADEWQDRYNMLAQACDTYHIGMIAVNPNAALIHGPASIKSNKEQSDKYHYRFPYVSDSHDKVTDAFGVRQFPIVFLFNQNLKLVYRGAIDDNPHNPNNVHDRYVMDAITSLGNGKTIPKAITHVNGCPVMRETD